METQTWLSRHNKFEFSQRPPKGHSSLFLQLQEPTSGFPSLECPLGGRCNSRNVVYQACISRMEQQRDGERIYIGIPAGNWKQR